MVLHGWDSRYTIVAYLYAIQCVVAQNDTNNFLRLSQTNNRGLLITLHVTTSPYQHRTKPSLKKEKFQLLTNHFDINQSTFIKIKLGYKFSLINLVWPNCSLWFLSNQKYFKKDSKFPFKRSKFYEENFYVPTLTTLLYLGDNYKLIMYLFYTKNSPTISN